MKMLIKEGKSKRNMFNNSKGVLTALLALAALLLREGSGVAAHLNVFLNSEEVMRLLGKFLFPLFFFFGIPFVIDFSQQQ